MSSESTKSTWRRVLAMGIAALFGTTILIACSKDNPNAAATSNTPPAAGGDRCATPNVGCPCDIPDKQVECGHIRYQSGDNVACDMGKRTCSAGVWSECVGTETGLKTSSIKVRTLHLMALADAGAACDGGDSTCDPFACFQLADDTTGLTDAGPGLTFTDAGLTIAPGDGGVSTTAEGPFVSTGGGVTTCGTTNLGANNAGVGSACTPGLLGYTQCEQDYRCDPATSKCMWNGGPGYYDTTLPAGTIDLTVGAPCGPGGSAPSTVPFCNRGNAPIPAGAVIKFFKQVAPIAGCLPIPVGTPEATVTLAAAMPPGQCVSTALGNSTGSKYITGYLVSGASEGLPYCNNNSAAWQTDGTPGCGACGGACTNLTTISGKVYDPSGTSTLPTGVTPADSAPNAGANNFPMAGVSVFQPSGALTTLTDNPAASSCESCDSLSSPALYKALTDGTGKFTLAVTPGKNVPIVVQSGHWRRTVLIDVPSACAVNDFETGGRAGTFRLPRSRTDGLGGFANLPKMALTTGSEESLGCLINKMGVADSEFANYSAAATNRVQIFHDNGKNATAPSATGTLFQAATMPKFHAIISECGTSTQGLHTPTAANKAALKAYVNGGGRYFANHRAADVLLQSSDTTWTTPVPATANGPGTIKWNGGGTVDPVADKTKLHQGSTAPAGASAAQAQFATWMTTVNANGGYPSPFSTSDHPCDGITWVGDKVIPWIEANGALDGSNCPSLNLAMNKCQKQWDGTSYAAQADRRILSMSFKSGTGGIDTTCGVVNGYGVVLFNEMHVAASRTNATATVPAACVDNGMTPEEKALEYQLFQLTACDPGGIPPVPPPPPPPPPPVATVAFTPQTYTRDFTATCPPGTRISWSYFYFSSINPTSGPPPVPSINFRAASADDITTLPTTPDPLLTVPIGKAIATGDNQVDQAAAPYNTALGPVSVASHLKIDPPTFAPPQAAQTSGNWLRVFFTFVPNGDSTTAATLKDWKATYDCVDSE